MERRTRHHAPARPRTSWLTLFSLLAMLVSCFTAAPASAQENASPLTPNAALYYWRVWFERDRDFASSIAEKHAYKSADAEWRPSPELVKELELRSGYISGILRASEIGPCDFGIAYEDGYMALIPHISLLRESARILAADARRLWMSDHNDEAMERIAAIVRMAGHTRSDRVAISALVGSVLIDAATDETAAMAKAGKLGAESRTKLAAIVRPLDVEDPMGIRNSVESERTIMLGYVRRRIESAGVKVIEEFVSLNQSDKDVLAKLRAMNKAELLKDIDQVDRYYRDALAAWHAADGKQKLLAMQSQITSGDYGVSAKLFAPALVRLFENSHKGREKVRELLALLDEKPVAK